MKSMYRLLILIFMSISFSTPLHAQDEPSINGTKKADLIFQESGLAIHGYDPVAYFKEAKPVKGKQEFQYSYQGATWRFDNAENRDAFIKNPAQYAPQYGGYCAFGMSKGYAVSTDPQAWSVVDGKLYLNFNPDVQKEWKKDVPGYVAKANENWPKIPKK